MRAERLTFVTWPAWWVVLLSTFVMTAAALPSFLTGALAVLVRDSLHFGNQGLGLAIAVFYMSSALTSAVIGRLVQRHGVERGIGFALAGTSMCLLGIGGLTRSWWHLVCFLVVGGLANAAARTSTTQLLIVTIRSGRHGLAFGLRQSSPALALLVAGLALPAVGLTLGWRWVYGGLGLLPLAVLPLIPRRPTSSPIELERGVRPESSRRVLLLLAATIGLGAAGLQAVTVFFVTTAVRLGTAPGRAGLLVAAMSVVELVLLVLLGMVADRIGRARLIGVAIILTVAGAGSVLLATQTELLLPLAALLAIGVGGSWTGLFSLAVAAVNRHTAAAATGVTHTGAYVGAGLGPFIFGWLASAYSYETAWRVASLWCFGAAVLAVLSRVRIKQELAATAIA